ncbi:MAG: folate-binding protein YgfZ [Acidobacteriaceae bacterium]|nr:folate-binding protein YgfZ [Acidobacteriaceae bacterium]MBV9498114.1 folate-binding protein YgfZ [Acidobacteriaceae bacterium]
MTGYEALRQFAGWIDLSSRGKIRVTGEDRARLLHAMSTNNVKDLAPGNGVYAFFLNDKGRILADAYIYNLDESFFLDTEPETGLKLRDHLDRYIIADDAYLEDETDRWACIGIEGPESLTTATNLGISVPDVPYGTRSWGSGFAAHVASTFKQGIRVFVPAENRGDLLNRLESAGVLHATPEEARIVRIENALPRYGEEITERYLVQETQAMHAVHSNKGCYLGQEIVERVRSRGQVHRLLAPIRIESATAPEPGVKLTANGQPAAEIASAVFSPALGEVMGMAYVRVQALHDKPEMIVARSEPPVKAFLR